MWICAAGLMFCQDGVHRYPSVAGEPAVAGDINAETVTIPFQLPCPSRPPGSDCCTSPSAFGKPWIRTLLATGLRVPFMWLSRADPLARNAGGWHCAGSGLRRLRCLREGQHVRRLGCLRRAGHVRRCGGGRGGPGSHDSWWLRSLRGLRLDRRRWLVCAGSFEKRDVL